MATKNINKIIGGNLNFKPWIAAKNTSEIVNSYVQKFYKQIPDNLKNDLFKPRLSALKTESRLPLRKVFPEKFNIPIISNKPTSKLRSNGYRSPAITRKNSFVKGSKKLLKTPNFKIYTKRRYASSVSSSKSSFVPNISKNIEEYRRKIYKPIQRTETLRGTEALLSSKNNYKYNILDTKSGLSSFGLMAINQKPKSEKNAHNLVSALKKGNTRFQPLDSSPYKRFSVMRDKTTNENDRHQSLDTGAHAGCFQSGPSLFDLTPAKQKTLTGKLSNVSPALKKENTIFQPLDSSPYKRLSVMPGETTTRETDRYQSLGIGVHGEGCFESGPSSFELMPVKRKPITGKVFNENPALKKENARLQPLGSTPYNKYTVVPGTTSNRQTDRYPLLSFGAHGKRSDNFNGLKIIDESTKEKSCNPKDVLNFVCLSRAERSVRSKNHRISRNS